MSVRKWRMDEVLPKKGTVEFNVCRLHCQANDTVTAGGAQDG